MPTQALINKLLDQRQTNTFNPYPAKISYRFSEPGMKLGRVSFSI